MDANQKAVVRIAELLDDARARLEAVEARLADLDRKHEAVTAAQKTWAPVMVARGNLIIASAATETASVPLTVVRLLAAGRPLDLDHRGAGDDEIELIDVRGRTVARLPRAAFLALPRVVNSAETAKLLGSAVRIRSGGAAQTGRTPSGVTAPAQGARRVSGDGARPDSVAQPTPASGLMSGGRPDSSGGAS